METRTERRTGVGLSRRTLLAGTAAAAGASAISWKVIAEQIETLKKEGWEANPVACKVCGGGCGLIIMKKTGVKPSLATVRVFPNPTHPQRGMCGRASQAAMLWASPYRLKKPLKRVGARGEGKFKEVSWDEALDGIAKQLKPIVEKYGESSVVYTSHTLSGIQKCPLRLGRSIRSGTRQPATQRGTPAGFSRSERSIRERIRSTRITITRP